MELIFLVLLFLPIACKATIKKDMSSSYTFEDKKILLDTIPKKPDFFLRKKNHSDFQKHEYLNETGFLPREEVTNTSSNSGEEDKKYGNFRRMREEEVNVFDEFRNQTITLGKGRAYYFGTIKNDTTKCIIEDWFYQENYSVPRYKVSKEDWNNAFNKSDECKNIKIPDSQYVVRIRFKDGKTIEYDTQNNHSDYTNFFRYIRYEYYYEHCFKDDYKEDSAYDVLEDRSGVWVYFKDIRRDYQDVVKMITDIGHYAKYQDTVDSGHCQWSANIQLKRDEIDFIEIRYR